MSTQLQTARDGILSEQTKYIVEAESQIIQVEAEEIREQVASGKLVIPANKLHLKTNLKPAGIGRILTTKVNANIGPDRQSGLHFCNLRLN